MVGGKLLMSKSSDEIMMLVNDINQYSEEANNKIIKESKENLYLDLAQNQVILINLVKDNRGISIGRLAEKMSITSSAVGQIISKLEKNQLVKRTTNPNNRREINVFLDTEGEKYFASKEIVMKDIITKYYSKLSLEELETLRDIVKKLHQIVNEN